ncbi:metal-dependent hydrolase [Natronosalvus caseinilyticus]|uniref:metal-dependent hydrolase n=1 Tax=Natronosalvus caseinilyticus TaxID=2953747 RepID=UPI0028ADB16B|nr:metal-dependent hydrolase [Natronosalvus caseinilyticus]
MADGLTHVLIAFALATLLSLRYEWLTPRFATVAMVGATLPDLNRLEQVLPPATVESAIGVSISWRPMHSIGGVVIVICIGSLLVQPQYRRAVALLLALGAFSHFVLDLLMIPGSKPYLWPLIGADISIPGFYTSHDRWPALLAILLALGARSIARHRRRRLLETELAGQIDG